MVPRSKSLQGSLWLVASMAAAVFVVSGVAKLSGRMTGQFEEWGYTPAFAVTIGFLELAGAVGLLIPRASGWASLGLIVIMFGALGTHLTEADYPSMLLPLMMLGLLSFVLFGRGLNLRGRAGPPVRSSANPAVSGI